MAQSRSGNQNKKNVGRRARVIASRAPGLVLPALAALGIGHSASALELGPARVQSTLGQPLRASIAFALRPFEQIAPYCIRVTPGRSASGLPSAGDAWVTLRDGAIRISGDTAVSEPLLALQLTVDCPYAPHLSREYVVFVDPEQPVETAGPQADQARPAPVTAGAPALAARQPQQAPIAASTTYRVERGDTLSGIAQRLSERRVGIWQAAELLFAANPGAFVDNDPDRLRAGALLRIPDALHAAQPSGIAAPAGPAREAPVPAPRASTAYAGYVPETATAGARPAARLPDGLFKDAAGEVQPARPSPHAADSAAPAAGQAHSPAAATTGPSPRPGDVLVETDGLFVSPIEIKGEPAEPAGAGIFVEPASDPAEPRVPAVPVTAPAPGDSGWSWLAWLAGTGVTLIFGLLVFGRKLQNRPAGRPLPGRDAFVRHEIEEVPADGPPLHAARMDVDFAFDEADADARIVRVDVDLDEGTGFQEAGDIDVAQDFGFSASGGLELGLDVDFSDEAPAMLESRGRRREGEVIVEQEIPPGESDTGEYDVSMIVDATRQPLGNTDDTEKDLHAIELELADADTEEDPFTLSHEVDYRILEQDYEEELTATQALSVELSNAARDLVGRMCHEPGETSLHELPTAEMPAPGAELTAELPRAGSRDPGASQTAEMLPASAMTERGDTDVNEDLAVLPDAGNDASAEMAIESATLDTKKLRAS